MQLCYLLFFFHSFSLDMGPLYRCWSIWGAMRTVSEICSADVAPTRAPRLLDSVGMVRVHPKIGVGVGDPSGSFATAGRMTSRSILPAAVRVRREPLAHRSRMIRHAPHYMAGTGTMPGCLEKLAAIIEQLQSHERPIEKNSPSRSGLDRIGLPSLKSRFARC
jgi:hypothetical protein